MHVRLGASSEKYNPNQAELIFDEAENPDVFDDQDESAESGDVITVPELYAIEKQLKGIEALLPWNVDLG